MVEQDLLAYCRIVVLLVFVISSVQKVRDLAHFGQAITSFRVLPKRFSDTAAIAFVTAEFAVVALMLVGGQALSVGFSLAISLLLIFSGALVSVLARHISASCECFGTDTHQISLVNVWRNLGLIVCASVGAATAGDRRTLHGSPSLLTWIIMALAAMVTVAVWLQLGEVVHFLSKERM